MSRRDRLVNEVYQALGANRCQQRWILPYHERRVAISVEGLANDGVITVSPAPLVETVIHECLHRAHPDWSERAIEQATTYLYRRLDDGEVRRLWDAWEAKAVIMRTAVESE